MGIIALLVFIAIIVARNVLLKRDIAEALIVGLVGVALIGGTRAPESPWHEMTETISSKVTSAGMTFVLMGMIVQSTGLIERLIATLNSVFDRLRGGVGYVSTLASAITELTAGSTAGNSATAVSVTIPWVKITGFTSNRAATLSAVTALVLEDHPKFRAVHRANDEQEKEQGNELRDNQCEK